MACSLFRLISRKAPPSCGSTGRARGFTLVELLIVIAILGILMAVVAPSLPSLLGAKAIGKAANEVAAVLERARAEAMSRRTYIYVGFLNSTNAAGNSELRIGAAASLDGTSSTTATATNLRALTRVNPMENMQMTDLGGLPQSVQSKAPPDLTNFVSTSATKVSFSIGKENFTNVPGIIISPQGELLPAAASFSFLPSASIGLIPTRKTTPLTNGKDGAIVTYRGGSGRIEITRP
jgi:prepilin-type N-terminal cleavage/methylation domain-containing protein